MYQSDNSLAMTLVHVARVIIVGGIGLMLANELRRRLVRQRARRASHQ